MTVLISADSLPVPVSVPPVKEQQQPQQLRSHYHHTRYQPRYHRNLGRRAVPAETGAVNHHKQYNLPSSFNVDRISTKDTNIKSTLSTTTTLSSTTSTASTTTTSSGSDLSLSSRASSTQETSPRTVSSSSVNSNSTDLFSVNSRNSLSRTERSYTDEENEEIADSQEDLGLSGDFTLSKPQSPQIIRNKTPVNQQTVLPNTIHTFSTPNLPTVGSTKLPSPSPAPFFSPQLPKQRHQFRNQQKSTAHRLHLQHPAEDLDFEDLDILLWNVPMIHPSIETDTFSKIHSSNKLWDDSELPPTSIPGVGPTNSGSLDLEQIHATSLGLSLVYTDTELDMARRRLKEREEAAERLPLEWKQLSDVGLEDLRLVSESKAQLACGSGRPSWLPPKDAVERRRHDHEIFAAINAASEGMLAKGEARRERQARDKTNDECVHRLLLEGKLEDSSRTIDELKDRMWETPFSDAFRCEAYERLLHADMEFIQRVGVHEPFSKLMNLLDEVQLPSNIEQEIQQRTLRTIHDKQMLTQSIKDNLTLLLKLKSLSAQGLVEGDTLIFYHLLLANEVSARKRTLAEVWSLEYAIQLVCFNELVRQSYNEEILNKKHVVQKQLNRCSGFKEENNSECLNFNTWWNVLERVDHQLFMWILDVIVVHNSHGSSGEVSTTQQPSNAQGTGCLTATSSLSWEVYRDTNLVNNSKILLSLALNILLNYHFGFNDLKSLKDLNDNNFAIPLPLSAVREDPEESYEANSKLIKRWAETFKLF